MNYSMKTKIMSIMIFLSLSPMLLAQSSTSSYYYYRSEKRNLQISNSELMVFTNNDTFDIGSRSSLIYEVSETIPVGNFISQNGDKVGLYSTRVLVSANAYTQTVSEFKTKPGVLAVEPVIDDSIPLALHYEFYIKVKKLEDVNLLYKVAAEAKCVVLRSFANMKNWYILTTSVHSDYNSLSAANYFYETGLFEAVDPGFLFNFKPNCVLDTRYLDQWAIDNTNVDINACSAWTLTTGSRNIVLAIIDHGIERTHSEFIGTYFTRSYDAETQTSPSTTYSGSYNHGTRVAGVAISNHNASQIAGVSPDVSIMDVSMKLLFTSSIYAEAITWAVNNGADVINNSWGVLVPSYIQSLALDQALDYAITSGRGGKGCIVVCASGNNSTSTVDYPANYRPEIMAIGSLNSGSLRSSFSSYGNELDIVAPGEDILLTLPANSYGIEDGTSFAAPHVAAVASLILSRFPHYTMSQVVNLIESTAAKVGSYTYGSAAGRLNGTWNQEVGYGLLDAYAAVHAGCNPYYYHNQTVHSTHSISACDVDVKDVIVPTNAKLIIDASNQIYIKSNFEAQVGAELEFQ